MVTQLIERPHPKPSRGKRLLLLLLGAVFSAASFLAFRAGDILAGVSMGALGIAAISGGITATNAPIDPLTLEPHPREARRVCLCCGFPSVFPGADLEACVLCGWEAGVDRSGPDLRRAKDNFELYLSSYSPEEAKAWGDQSSIAVEKPLKQELIAAYSRLNAVDPDESHRIWEDIETLEIELHKLRHATSDMPALGSSPDRTAQ